MDKNLLKRVDKASLKNKIEQLVEKSMRQREIELNKKREKLRRLFHQEDTIFHDEVKESMAEKINREMQERKNKILATQQQRERETMEFLKQKKLQQYVSACDDVRPYLRQQLLIDSKACQRSQMEDRKRQQQVARETQSMWMEIAQRTNNVQLEREKEERRKRKIYAKNTEEYLRRQMEEKRLDKVKFIEMASSEERRRNEEELEKQKAEDANERKEIIKKRVKLVSDLKDQLQQAEQERLARKAQEAELNHLFNDSIKKDLEKQILDKKSEIEALKEETTHYLNYVEKMKKERQLEENKKDRIIEEIRIKKEKEQIAKNQEDAQKRRNFLEQIYEKQRLQVKDNEERQKAKNEQEFKEAAEERAKIDLKAEQEIEMMRKHQQAKLYAKDLIDQEEYFRAEAKKAKEHEEAKLRKILEENRKCEEEARKFVSQNIDVLPPHPHTKIMKSRKECTHTQDHIKLRRSLNENED